MMAPGMQEIALKYGITNSTVLALTLSIFLLALAIGVSKMIVLRMRVLTKVSHSSSVLYQRSTAGHGYVCSRTTTSSD